MATSTSRPEFRFAAGPFDGRRLGVLGAPSVVRLPVSLDQPGAGGCYVQDIATGTYRWYPPSVRVDPLACETEVDAEMVFRLDGVILRFAIDEDCPRCGWGERWFEPGRQVFGCTRRTDPCGYESTERNA